MNVEKNLGVVTAYGSAIQGGYNGTAEEFYEELANLPQYASRAETAAETSEEDVQTVLDAKDAAETAAQNASDSASTASTAAQNASAAQQAAEDAQAAAEDAAASITTDDTLSITGKAADAKKTGDEIAELKNDLDENVSDLKSAITQLDTEIFGENPNIPINDIERYYMNNEGTITLNSSYNHGFANISDKTSVIVDSTALSDTVIINVCNQNKEFIRNIVNWGSPNTYNINVTSGDYYVCVSAKTADLPVITVSSTEVSTDNVLARLDTIEETNTEFTNEINNVSIYASNFERINFFKHYNIINAYIDNSYTIKSNANNKTVWVKLLPNTLYCLSVDKKANTDMRAALYNAEPIAELTGLDAGYANTVATSFYRTFTTTNDYVYLAIKYWVTGASTYTEQEVLDSIKILISNGCVTADIVSKLNNAKHVPSNAITPLTLVHFSDLHADTQALKRITSGIDALDASVDDSICTGDIVGNTAGQIRDWWPDNILTCVGNHDTASYSQGSYNWTALSMADRDAYYIAPFESNWGITHTAGTSYYYKDYATQKVRLIVMDVMLYNDNGAEAAAQTAWLENLLADAITNNMHVIIAIHAPHGGATAEDCSFSRYGQTAMPTYNDCNTPQSVIDTVAAKITDGLKFVGYLVGHDHQDNIWDAENDGTQLMYCITCAAVTQTAQWNKSDQFRDAFHDAYNILTIDTANTLVKIIRGGGADIDDHMRTRKAICFNYSTGQMVGEVL